MAGRLPLAGACLGWNPWRDAVVGGWCAETVDVTKKNKAIETAVLLGENSTYQEDSLLHYFEEYGLTYHDDAFYEYLSSTYEELFEE